MCVVSLEEPVRGNARGGGGGDKEWGVRGEEMLKWVLESSRGSGQTGHSIWGKNFLPVFFLFLPFYSLSQLQAGWVVSRKKKYKQLLNDNSTCLIENNKKRDQNAIFPTEVKLPYSLVNDYCEYVKAFFIVVDWGVSPPSFFFDPLKKLKGCLGLFMLIPYPLHLIKVERGDTIHPQYQ